MKVQDHNSRQLKTISWPPVFYCVPLYRVDHLSFYSNAIWGALDAIAYWMESKHRKTRVTDFLWMNWNESARGKDQTRAVFLITNNLFYSHFWKGLLFRYSLIRFSLLRHLVGEDKGRVCTRTCIVKDFLLLQNLYSEARLVDAHHRDPHVDRRWNESCDKFFPHGMKWRTEGNFAEPRLLIQN